MVFEEGQCGSLMGVNKTGHLPRARERERPVWGLKIVEEVGGSKCERLLPSAGSSVVLEESGSQAVLGWSGGRGGGG